VGQKPAIPIQRSDIGFQPYGRSCRQQLEQGAPSLAAIRLLLRLGTVDADETDPAAIPAAKRVAIGNSTDDAARFPLNLLLRGTGKWRGGQREAQEREAHWLQGCRHALHVKSEQHESTKTRKQTNKTSNNANNNISDVYLNAGVIRQTGFVLSCFRDCCCFFVNED
jgi:hypothetical protein